MGAIAALAVLAACGPRAWGEPEPLVVADGWRTYDGVDPFGEQPQDAYCDPLGWGPEDFGGEPSLDVRTGICKWLTVRQATNADIQRTDRLFFRLWHDQLISASPGVPARIGLASGEEVLFLREIPLPAYGGIVLEDLALGREIPAGTDLLFHVDNHGANSYHLLEVSRRPAVAPRDAVHVGVQE